MSQRVQYEYKMVFVKHDDVVKTLNMHGRNGWRVVSSHTFSNDCVEFVLERKSAG